MKFLWKAAAGSHVASATGGVVGRILKRFDGSTRWRPASTAPFNRDIQLYTSGDRGSYTIPFPCRQTRAGWINADLNVKLDIEPSEWRVWPTGKFGPLAQERNPSPRQWRRVPARALVAN
jgi:hypothetical protein